MKLDDKDKLIAELLERISKLEQLVANQAKIIESQAEKIKTLEARLKKTVKTAQSPHRQTA